MQLKRDISNVDFSFPEPLNMSLNELFVSMETFGSLALNVSAVSTVCLLSLRHLHLPTLALLFKLYKLEWG